MTERQILDWKQVNLAVVHVVKDILVGEVPNVVAYPDAQAHPDPSQLHHFTTMHVGQI